MNTLEFKNVIGNENTVTPLNKVVIQNSLKQMPMFIDQEIPSNWQAPEGYTLEKLVIDGVKVERTTPIGKTNGKIILNFHGGAYVVSLMDNSRMVTDLYAKRVPGAVVYSVDYRVAPSNPYPAALEDALAVYKWLLNEGYKGENIVITGESAGAGLAFALTLYLKDHGIELPKGVLAISPWADLSYTAPSRTINHPNDILLGEGGIACLTKEIMNSSYVRTTELTNPYASPIYGDYTGFPKLLIQVGTFETLYDDSVTIAKKAEAAGVSVKMSSYYGMSHCFQQSFLDLPESQLAWEEIQTFFNECFN